MARNKDSGFHSAAGLIRYFDQEDEKALKVTNLEEANRFVHRAYRKGWEVDGL